MTASSDVDAGGDFDAHPHLERFQRRDWTAAADGRVRYAVVGLGWFPQEFALDAIAAGDLCETTVLVSGDAAKADRLAAAYDVEHVLDYAAFRAGAAVDAYDAVYVCTPNATHLDYVETAADLGKAVLCEKPLEVDVDRTERLLDACADAGVTLMTAYRQQTEPGMRRLRRLLAAGLIGDPVYATGNFSVTLLGRDADADQWRLDPAMAGGGTLVDLGVYPLNTTRFLIDTDPVAVAAETTTADARYAGVEEHVSFQLSFPGETTAAFAASYGAHLDDRLTLVGTEGKVTIESAFLPDAERTVHVEREGLSLSISGGSVSGIDEEFEYFANCLLTDTHPDPDGADGLTDVRVIEAGYEAAAAGDWVSL